MSKWISDSYLDLILNEIKKSDGESICSQQPLTYFNAAHPNLHELSGTYEVGDTVRPPDRNGFIYECVQAGTSGSNEPGWGLTQGQEFTDGSIKWKTHENYSLAYTGIDPNFIVIEDAFPDGRVIKIPQIMGVVTHGTGTVTNCALIENATKKLQLVTDAETTIPEDNEVVSGRTTIFFELEILMRDPQ